MASRVTPLHQPKGADRIAWRRSRRRAWKRPDQSGSTAIVFALMPSLSRAELARLTARLIDRMDEIDGDTDLELEHDRCPAGDDGCSPLRSRGRIVWGSDEDQA